MAPQPYNPDHHAALAAMPHIKAAAAYRAALAPLLVEARPYAELMVDKQRADLCPTYFERERDHMVRIHARAFAEEAYRTRRSVAEVCRRFGLTVEQVIDAALAGAETRRAA